MYVGKEFSELSVLKIKESTVLQFASGYFKQIFYLFNKYMDLL